MQKQFDIRTVSVGRVPFIGLTHIMYTIEEAWDFLKRHERDGGFVYLPINGTV